MEKLILTSMNIGELKDLFRSVIQEELEKLGLLKDEHKTELMRSYSYFLKVLIEEKNKSKVSSRFLAKGLGCSIGKISNFENEKVIDFNMCELCIFCNFC